MTTLVHRTLIGALALLLGSLSLTPVHAHTMAPSLEPMLAASSASQPARQFDRGQRAMRIASDPALAAITQLRLMERIYLRQNQPKEADRMYREVLDRTQNTQVRNFVNFRLAKLAAWQPRNLDAAMVELKRGLDENLAKLQ